MIKQVFRDLSGEVIEQAAQRYGTVPSKLQSLGAYENLVFHFPAATGRRILRLTHSSHRTQNAVEAELDWVRHLTQLKIPCASPLPSTQNNLTERIELASGYITASSFVRVPGERLSVWNGSLLFYLGGLMARMHLANKSYLPRSTEIMRHRWSEEVLTRAQQIIPDEPSVVRKCEEMECTLRKLPASPDNFGLIHADVHEGNFHAADNQIKLFDFDDCHYSWFVNDIAILMYESLVKQQINRENFRAMFTCFAQGYQKHLPLPPDWLEQLQLFLRLRDIYVFLFFRSKFQSGVISKRRKAHLAKLKARIEQERLVVPI